MPSSGTLPAELVADLSRPHARVLYVDGMAASHVDLRDPQQLHMDYQWRLGAALDALRPERGGEISVVHLGGGALALPRFVAATRPRARQRIFEIDESLVVLARRELGGRKLGLRCVDAAEGLARVERADVVIGDTFDGTEVPAHLATPEFTADVARVLGSGGLYLLNVIDTAPWEVSQRHERMLRDVFAHVLVFGAREVVAKRRAGNVLFAASPVRLRREALSRTLASGAFAGSLR